jgi:hypothetical protein
MLDQYGEKKAFQLNIREQTNPPKELNLIRKYCSSPVLIPKNQRFWWLTILTFQLSYEIEKNKQKLQLFISNTDKLLQKLEFFYNQEKQLLNKNN